MALLQSIEDKEFAANIKSIAKNLRVKSTADKVEEMAESIYSSMVINAIKDDNTLEIGRLALFKEQAKKAAEFYFSLNK